MKKVCSTKNRKEKWRKRGRGREEKDRNRKTDRDPAVDGKASTPQVGEHFMP